MTDRFKYSEVRQKIIDALRTDLIGPKEREEVLEENPRYAYLVGMLDVQSDDEDYSGAGEQEVDVPAPGQRRFAQGVRQEPRHFADIGGRADHEGLFRMDGREVAVPDPVQKVQRFIFQKRRQPPGGEARVARGTKI